MFLEKISIEKVLAAKIAPWMRQNLSTSVACWVSILNVLSERLNVINSLFADENCTAFKTHQAKSLLVHSFHVLPKAVLVMEVLLCGAITDEAC